MQKYVLHIGYDGSQFRGWQRQNNVPSIQETFEQALSKVLNKTTSVFGCGRTDALVHASQYFLQFSYAKVLDEKFIFIMNKVLPPSIRVYDLAMVKHNFSVQNHAVSRSYRYYLHTKSNAFINNYSSYYSIEKPKISKMTQAASAFIGHHDFHSFCKTPDKHMHTMVNVYNVDLTFNRDKSIICIEFKADRFLKGMIRAIVHHIIQIGEGKMSLSDVSYKLQTAAFFPNIQLAHPQGLYLSEVAYDELDFESVKEPLWYMLKY
ncbi:MAG: tRNA pseudouridine(38-40) synthase TruA [Bacteroidia bacterium]